MNVDLEGAEATRSAQAAGLLGSAAATYALGTQGVAEEDGPVWTWISGGGCDVDANSQISWLSPTGIWISSLMYLLNNQIPDVKEHKQCRKCGPN